jgi:peptidyl-prolyl cis-trans isomerase D
MRKHARSWIIKLALGAIIIVFIFLYGWSEPPNPVDNQVADVNGTVVTANYFNALYEAERESLRRRYKGDLPKELLEKLNLKEKLLKRMIDQILLLQEAERLGFFVTEDDLVNDIRNDPRFQRAGIFDQRIYNAFLRSVNLSASAYEKTRKQDILQEQVVTLLTDGIKFDPNEIREFWHYQNDKLVLSMLLIKPKPVSQMEVEDPKALEAFYNKNQDDYQIPRQYTVDYVAFSGEDLEERIEVTEQEAKEYYDSHPGEFTIPEKISARHILLKVPKDADEASLEKTKQKMIEIRERIVKGADFAEVAKEVSEDEATKEKGGSLGLFSRGALSEPLEEAAFNLEEGKVSQPVKTSLGYHIVMVDETRPEEKLSFDKVKDKIVSKIKAQKAGLKVNTVADDFYERVYRSENLKRAAQEFGFDFKTAGNVTANTGIPELSGASALTDELVRLSTNQISRLLRIGDAFAVIQIKEIIEPRVPDLDEVRDEVERDYLKMKALDLARKEADKIIEEIESKPDELEKRAKEHGLSWETLKPVSRTVGLVPKLGTAPEIQEVLSTVSPAAPLYPEPVPVTEGIALIRLKELEKADQAKFEKEKESFKRWITQVRATDYLNSWLKLLRDRSQIEVNEKFL